MRLCTQSVYVLHTHYVLMYSVSYALSMCLVMQSLMHSVSMCFTHPLCAYVLDQLCTKYLLSYVVNYALNMRMYSVSNMVYHVFNELVSCLCS